MIDLSTIDVSAFPHWRSPGGEVLLVNADVREVLTPTLFEEPSL